MPGKTKLHRKKREYFDEEQANPMESVANLVDVMLVFSCGLMMALISFYNVDINGVRKEIPQENMWEIQNDGIIDEEGNISQGFESRGTVYEDKKTRKMYIIEPEEQEIN